MRLNVNRGATRSWALTAIAAATTILMAATNDPGDNWLRLGSLPRQERQRLVDNLQKFDLVYTAEQQQALRDLDRRINELDPDRRAQYLTAMRRYHLWLDRLPELKQGELQDKPPGERMALVRKLATEHPVAPAVTTRFLQVVDVGDHSPFELAAIYQIWQQLTPGERLQIEKAAPGARRQQLFKKAEKKKLTTEVKPTTEDEEKWISAFNTWVLKNRPALANLVEKDARGTEILRRQAINFHFLEAKNQVKVVNTAHLAEFLASFPPWLKSSFDHYPPDEARRRLGVVYRLVFPPGSEIKVGTASHAPSAGEQSKPAPAPSRSAPKPAGKKTSEPGDSPF